MGWWHLFDVDDLEVPPRVFWFTYHCCMFEKQILACCLIYLFPYHLFNEPLPMPLCTESYLFPYHLFDEPLPIPVCRSSRTESYLFGLAELSHNPHFNPTFSFKKTSSGSAPTPEDWATGVRWLGWKVFKDLGRDLNWLRTSDQPKLRAFESF